MEEFAGSLTSPRISLNRRLLQAARVLWAAVFALLLALVVASLVGGDLLQRVGDEWLVRRGLPAARAFVQPDTFYIYLLVLRYAALAVFWLVALLIFWRRSDDWVALLVSWVLLLIPFSLIPGEEDASLETPLAFLGLTLFLLLFYLFPDGRFIPQSRRGRATLAAALLVTPFLSFAMLSLLQPELAAEERAFGAFSLTWGATLICGVASQIYRFRQVSDTVERQQTRWVLFGLGAQLLWILAILLLHAGLWGTDGGYRHPLRSHCGRFGDAVSSSRQPAGCAFGHRSGSRLVSATSRLAAEGGQQAHVRRAGRSLRDADQAYRRARTSR
jgi:hypothetical protein